MPSLEFRTVRTVNRQIGRYAALSNLNAGTYEFITSGGARYNTSYVAGTNLANPKSEMGKK